ncbi:C2H2-type zinc finger protein [Rhizobium sp. AU243]|uniref:C2H2-type zinc finger protein n=1 Tax=Rhizobium sp. AU243 TaxID=2303425 RepID=UPI0010CC3B07|nr:C2H2-type zinc finger protein [Rhizobium sp. AU243]TKV70371.1 hypothetical protein D0C28_26385 [Rhizobium sp. AU243]
MQIDAETIEAIWRALQKAAPAGSRRTNAMDERIAASGWASAVDLEDYLLSQDRRLDPPAVVDPKVLAEALGLPFRSVFPRPRRRTDDVSGYDMLSAADTAALCIWLERLGFRIDVADLCARVRPRLDATTHLTDEEISVLFYEANRHRLPPVTLSGPHREWRGMTTSRFKTSSGYRLEYVFDDDGRALRLTARSPKYRKRPESVAMTCPHCGMTYVKGSRTDEQLHRSFHRKRFSVIEPKPHRRFSEALDRDLDAAWVDARSPKWKRTEVFGRALEFKRELGYDFIQWSLEAQHDPDAIGFLFSGENGRIVGACSFRPQDGASDRPWRLDWIWICPNARRLGQLDRHWDRFRQRFGVFDVEHPVSDAMQAFLRKRGCADLLRFGAADRTGTLDPRMETATFAPPD